MVAPETPQKSENGGNQNVKPEDVSGETGTPGHQKTKSVGFCDVGMVESPETKTAEHAKEVNLIDMEGEVLYENKKEETTSGTTDIAEEALICRHSTRDVRKCAHSFVMGITDISPTAVCNVSCVLCRACQKCVENYNMSSKPTKSLGQPIPAKQEDEGPRPATASQTEDVSGDSAESAKSLGQAIPAKQEDEGTIPVTTTQTEDVSGNSAKSKSLGQPTPAKLDDEGPRPAMPSQAEDVSGDSAETKSLDQPIPPKHEGKRSLQHRKTSSQDL
ncbi:uncharacterized protein LOC128504377 [Spea bombifrons]|uniref:uncharacterized protein LOC128504377 n=1 Tax=Spea bombifrons TaxID=233779 RepID=UPI00234B31F8|nr:uncharacterized protein LOC128504377 [Spea bombifrons]